MSEKDFFGRLAAELKNRNNPTDLKASIIGKVVELEPITVQVEDGAILLVENEHLQLSEWFKFRCNINKDNSLSDSVNNSLNSAKQIKETHSNGGTPCNIPTAIEHLANAINSVCTELINLKCDLKQNDYVIVASLEETDKYILIDKV